MFLKAMAGCKTALEIDSNPLQSLRTGIVKNRVRRSLIGTGIFFSDIDMNVFLKIFIWLKGMLLAQFNLVA